MMKKDRIFLFLMTDEQRYDAVGYVNPQVLTPHLDAMARESVLLSERLYHQSVLHSGQGGHFTGRYLPSAACRLYEFPAGKGNPLYGSF